MTRRKGSDAGDLDALIEEITVDAHDDDEQMCAFQQVIEDEVTVPVDGFVIGEPVTVIEFDYEGNERRGLTAKCQRADGAVHIVSASDVVLPQGSTGARYLAAYRKWLGLEPLPASPAKQKRQHKATADDLDLSGPVDLVALAVKENTALCRLMGSDRVITLRATGLWKVVPGQIVTVKPGKQWSYAGHPYLSGEIEATRIDVGALGLVPLSLKKFGTWDPKDEYWGEEGEPVGEWVKAIIARGPRPMYEMEQVLPGYDPGTDDDDPISKSNDLKESGERGEARSVLVESCQADLRCLDAHAHLGLFAFEGSPEEAICHYEMGVRIGELSLGDGFDGVLSWGLIDNRPFLRCMKGYGLCLWRLERFEEALRVFERMLWLNPSDNQGVRLLLDEVRAGKSWSKGG